VITDHLSPADAATLQSFMAWEDRLSERAIDTLGDFPVCLTPEAGRALKALSAAYRAELRAQRGGAPPTRPELEG
jgi:hypothetical protein